MASRGFGEMAITALIAGPIFNILVGSGASSMITIATYKEPLQMYLPFSMYDANGNYDKEATIVLTLMFGGLTCLIINLMNGIVNNYKLKFSWTIPTLTIYVCSLLFLIIMEFAVSLDEHE